MAAALSSDTYQGSLVVNFFTEDERLSVTTDALRLQISSVTATESEHDNYAALFRDAMVISKFARGETKSREYVERRIQG